jgi:hypothetical protein
MDTHDIQDLARTLDRETFARKFKSSFLVVDRSADEPANCFETIEASSVPTSLLQTIRGVEAHEIVKSSNSPYQDRISVGRARNCDVVLRYPSVSKLHGYFRALADGQLEFVDVGSHVGTRLNGRTLQPNMPEIVKVGHVLLLGRVSTRLAAASAVWDLFKARERRPGSGGSGVQTA